MKAVVQTDIATMYAKPEQGPCIDEVLYGMTVEVLENQGDFCRVRTHYRYEGYVKAVQLMETPQTDAWAPNRMVTAPYLDVLDAPKVQGVHLQSVPRGGYLQAEGEADNQGWQSILLADGRRGYAKATGMAPMPKPMQKPSAAEEAALRRAVCETAKSYLGVQYRWGGKTPLGIDCSGLTSMAYMMNGVIIYRDAEIKEGFPIQAIPRAEMKQGDLLYFPGHIALYLGEGRFIHATAHPGTEGVIISSLTQGQADYRKDLDETLYAVGSFF